MLLATLASIARGVAGIVGGVNLLADRLTSIETKVNKIMAELDDLKAATAALATAVGDGTTEINNLVQKILSLLGAPAGVDPAAVEAVATEIKTQADAINTAVAAAKASAGV